MGADISIIKTLTQPFNHCIDVADVMECKSQCCGEGNTCSCDTKNSRVSRDSDATLTPAHSRQQSKYNVGGFISTCPFSFKDYSWRLRPF